MTPEASERDRHPFLPFLVELPPTASTIKPITYVDPDADPHGIKAWDKEFLCIDNSTLFEIILVSNQTDSFPSCSLFPYKK